MDHAIAQDVVLRLTEAAAAQVKALQAQDPPSAGKPLRLFVEDGGCSGLQYGMLFDEPREGDQVAAFQGVSVVVDRASAEYLRGAVVDFADGPNESGFKISNPNARHSCGCGKSFEAPPPPSAEAAPNSAEAAA